ncbi:hypothetical protein [uncultured Aquimarina sp.]|uniref:hypothetical protein n=1 Tax=uncultured Aquimarina sp. TaxID=575652 RepID=UPI002626FD4D|nr:hypothetical protein [uncultured Aquimarina sp.]
MFTIIIGSITAFCIWIYIEKAKLPYDANGTYFSEEGIVYHEQAKEVYGLLSIIGLLITSILAYKLIRK